MGSVAGGGAALEPVRLDNARWDHARWSVYLIRVMLIGDRGSGLKVGMVGTGTIASRMSGHARRFGAVEVLDVWTVAHNVEALGGALAWRLSEQYEARLQFAPEFDNPTAALRMLRPDTGVFSYEWFVDDQRVIDSVRRWALHPIAIPARP